VMQGITAGVSPSSGWQANSTDAGLHPATGGDGSLAAPRI
jgi:hypothetical protein